MEKQQKETPPLWGPSSSIILKKVTVSGKVEDRLAEFSVSHSYRNRGQKSSGVTFRLPCHEEFGTVSSLELIFEDKTHSANILPRTDATLTEVLSFPLPTSTSLEVTDAQEVFVCSVQDVPAGKEVTLKVGFVNWLGSDEQIRLVVPTNLAPTSLDEESELFPDLFVNFSIQMRDEIKSIESPSHTIDPTVQGKTATIKFEEYEVQGDSDFVLFIRVSNPSELFVPVIENQEGAEKLALALSFNPSIQLPAAPTPTEFVFLVDCSYSMTGGEMTRARSILEHFVKKIPTTSPYNIIALGEAETKAFNKGPGTIETATTFIKKLSADSLNEIAITDAIESAIGARTSPHQAVVLLTNGSISDSARALSLLRSQHFLTSNQLFIIGVSPRASHHLLRKLAKEGGGAVDYVDNQQGSGLEKIAERTIQRALQQVKDLSIDWGTLKPTLSNLTLRSIYSLNPITIFALVDSFSGETTVTLKGHSSAGPFSQSQTLKFESAQKGKSIHRLAAAVRIKELEEDEANAEEITILSTSNGIGSNFARFASIQKAEGNAVQLFFTIRKKCTCPGGGLS